MADTADDFFVLTKPFVECSCVDAFWLIIDENNLDIENLLYRPNELTSREPPRKWRIRNKTFRNVSFSKTHISFIEFADCKFFDCLFIGAIISDCRFTNCEFLRSNFYRAQIERSFIDPRSFSKCLNPKRHQNIGVSLFQELLHNSRQQSQPEFTREAQFQFLRWKRYMDWREAVRSGDSYYKKMQVFFLVFFSWMFEITTGSGMRLRNLAATFILSLIGITALNYVFRMEFGLSDDGKIISSLCDSFYFSTIVITSLGFGDITPTTWFGRLVIAIEALVGFVLFATFVSMVFRRITS